ncbi:MAG: LysR family transcriptional regulator [Myxococcales bacterium]|nr:MAG: LysR family transcriptional regulator [Myxococcales bacterium]
MRFTLRQLEVFLAVARDESVSRAAERLHLSQSAVSSSLADLERQFDVRLFDRLGKRLQLSDRGRALRAPARALLDQAAELERGFEDRSELGSLRLGATLTIGDYLAVPLIARFMAEHPGVEVSLAIANTEEIARRVANFELDVGLLEGELTASDLEVTAFRDDELVVFCAPDHPFARRRALSDADLRAASWVLREPGSGTRQAFDRAMAGLLPGLHIVLTLQQTEALKAAVMAGLGVGCISRLALAGDFARGTLVPCRVPQRDFRRQLSFALHRHRHRREVTERWLDLCRSSWAG